MKKIKCFKRFVLANCFLVFRFRLNFSIFARMAFVNVKSIRKTNNCKMRYGISWNSVDFSHIHTSFYRMRILFRATKLLLNAYKVHISGTTTCTTVWIEYKMKPKNSIQMTILLLQRNRSVCANDEIALSSVFVRVLDINIYVHNGCVSRWMSVQVVYGK